MPVRFVGTRQPNGQVNVTNNSRPPAGYVNAGPQMHNGQSFRAYLEAKSGMYGGFYSPGYADWQRGTGVVKPR